MKLCDIWRVLRPGKYDFKCYMCYNYGLTEDFNLLNSWNFKRKAVQFSVRGGN